VDGVLKNHVRLDTIIPGQLIGTTCGKCGDLSHAGKECYSAEHVTHPRDMFRSRND
jgi:hypothetical protein